VALYLIGADVQHKAEADLFPGKVDGRGISDQAPIILKVTVDQITVAWVNRSPQEASQILATKITELIAPPIGQMEEAYYRIKNQAFVFLGLRSYSTIRFGQWSLPIRLHGKIALIGLMTPTKPKTLVR
jgi:hypothetical protein